MYDIAEIYAQNLHAEPHFFTTKVGIINLDTYRRDSENESGYLTYPTLSYQNLNKKLYNQASLINIFIFLSGTTLLEFMFAIFTSITKKMIFLIYLQ